MNLGKKTLSVAGTGILLCLALAMHAVGQFGGRAVSLPVEAKPLEAANFETVAPTGKEADAIYGDVTLRNALISAVIAQPLATRHANMTVRDVAGALIDLTVRGKSEGDQLAAFYPGRKAFAYRSLSIRDPNDIPVPKDVAVIVKAEATDDRPEVTVTYQLSQDQPFLFVTSNFINRGSNPLTVALEDDFRADGQKEDMIRSPNWNSRQFWLYDEYWGQAYGLDAEGYLLRISTPVNADGKQTNLTTIKYENAKGETSVTLAPGESFQLKRRLYPGATIFDVAAIAGTAEAIPVEFRVEDFTGSLLRNVSLQLSEGETVLGSARMDNGRLNTRLPAGDYTAELSFCGNAVGKSETVKVASGQQNLIVLKQAIQRGKIIGSITDAAGGRIPCKIELKPLDPNNKLNFGPETAEFAVRNLIYSPNGSFQQAVPAGKYAVTISHGPEFDIVQADIDVPDGGEASLKAKLVRSVDTTGWISSDFHSHSTPSGDNTSSQLGRVLNLVCEHIEFAPCTEHNRVSTYAPHIKQLGIEPFLASVSGIELTGGPLPLNHQNAFPMKYTPGAQDNGGPVSGPDLETQIERLALWDDRSEKLLQVNHPDMGWMFYDKDGDGKPDAGYERGFPFMDVVEIHPIQDALHLGPTAMRGKNENHNTVFDWLQLLNQGFRIYGVVNTDAHYNYHGSGFLRNWIQSSTDDPAKIEYMDMVPAAEQGRLVMSNGPYLEVTATETGKSDKVVSGQDLKAASGKVSLKVRVQCPNWLDVNRLFVLVNGRPHPMHDYSRDKNPDAFRSGVVKVERTLDLDLKGDSHLVVVTGQTGGSLGPVLGPNYGKAEPAALSNPIFVDVDGNGFQPNKDTLGAALPVKHPNSK